MIQLVSYFKSKFNNIKSLSYLLIPNILCQIGFVLFCFMKYKINFFALSGLLLGVCSFVLAHIILSYSTRKVHIVWGWFNLTLTVWGISIFFLAVENSYNLSMIYWRIFVLGLVYIGVFFYHVVSEFCEKKNDFLLKIIYLQGFIFSALIIFTNIVVNSLRFEFNQFWYIKESIGFTVFLLVWAVVVSLSFYRLFKFKKLTQGIQRTQANYLFYGMLLGFLGGVTTGPLTFDIKIYPFGPLLICIYAAVSTYAIFRYRLMDMRVAITNTAIFIVVYALVLGIPFFFGYKYHLWQISTWAMLVLATAGPFILFYLQRRVEDRLLQEEKRIQGVLIKASESMTSIGNLEKLLKLIINILLNNLRLKGAAVYLLDRESDSYVLKASLPGPDGEVSVQEDNPLVHRLKQSKNLVIYEEVDFSKDDNPQNNHAQEIMAQMREISAEVIIPMALEKVLIGFIVLGERTEKSTYSGTLISVLSIVGTQATLAVQDALYLRAETERVEHEGAQARRSNLDTMVSTMSHQIASPLNSIKLDLAFFEEILNDDDSASPQLKKLLKERVESTEGIVTHISEIIQSVRDFSRGQIVYENFSIDEMMKSFAPIKNGINKEYPGAVYKENIEHDLPLIFGDQSMLKEILVIYLNNAHQALKHNVGEKIIKLNISRINGNFVRFEVVDNGYGINNEVKKKLFETIYTSKGAGQGMGIGLTRIRRVCELMGAKYGFDSKGEGKGAQFWVDVKIVKNEGAKEG